MASITAKRLSLRLHRVQSFRKIILSVLKLRWQSAFIIVTLECVVILTSSWSFFSFSPQNCFSNPTMVQTSIIHQIRHSQGKTRHRDSPLHSIRRDVWLLKNRCSGRYMNIYNTEIAAKVTDPSEPTGKKPLPRSVSRRVPYAGTEIHTYVGDIPSRLCR